MKRLLEIGICLGLAMPLVAYANTGRHDVGTPQTSSQMYRSFGNTYSAGVVRGRIASLNLSQGVLRIRTDRRLVLVNATPQQLEGVNRGDQVAFPCMSYQGHLWLAPSVGGQRSSFYREYRQQGHVTGSIQRIHRGEGMLTVRGQEFRVHPSQLQGITSGMFVRLGYTQIGNTNWISEIVPVNERTNRDFRANRDLRENQDFRGMRQGGGH